MAINQRNHELLMRLKRLRVFMIIVFVLFGFKLWQLTIVEYTYYHDLALRNQIRTIPLMAPRGNIIDREGRTLADSISSFNLYLLRDEAEDLTKTVQFLLDGLGLDQELLHEALDRGKAYSEFKPIPLKENLSMQEIAFLMARQSEHPELRMYEQPRRRYPHRALAAHVLGLVGEISREELKRTEFRDSRPGTIVGKAGIERLYNRLLTGRDGYRHVLVNSLGKVLQEIRRVEPAAGSELKLTLDWDLQAVAEAELGDQPGAIVLLDPRSGEILSLASRPAFDPNLFASGISRTQWSQLIENPDHPFQNRAVQSTFSPGSIFKVVMAMAGLELGFIDEKTSVYCNGSVRLYGRTFHCWKRGGHGRIALREAIQHSCNVYFYLLGKRMGIRNIAEFSRRIGLGRPTGVDLLGEKAGLVPSDDWKRRVQGQPWYPGETISVSIGQGPLDVTPLQLARTMGIICTGKVPSIHILADPESGLAHDDLQPPALSQDHIRLIREAMWRSVNAWGTGRGAKVTNYAVCGKTGTAQTIGREVKENLSDEAKERFQNNAWFVGFAPEEDPEVVVAVIVQRGGSGGSAAAPLAGKLLAAYHDKYGPKIVEGRQFALSHD